MKIFMDLFLVVSVLAVEEKCKHTLIWDFLLTFFFHRPRIQLIDLQDCILSMDFEEETTVCTICHENKSKYTCPACEIKHVHCCVTININMKEIVLGKLILINT